MLDNVTAKIGKQIGHRLEFLRLILQTKFQRINKARNEVGIIGGGLAAKVRDHGR